jgi:hypothetical protein
MNLHDLFWELGAMIGVWVRGENMRPHLWARRGINRWELRCPDRGIHSMIYKEGNRWRAQSLNIKKDDPRFGFRIDASWHHSKQEAMHHCEGLTLVGIF